MTLSAVSRRLSDLEQLIGIALFERRFRSMELTPAGHALLAQAQFIVSASERLAGTMTDFAQGIRGRIKLWANTSAVIQFLPKDLYAYRSLYKEVRIEMQERLSEDTVRALQAGDIDLGIVAQNCSSVGLEKTEYRKDQLVLVVPTGHTLQFEKQLKLEHILEQQYVGTNEGSAILRLLSDLAGAQGRSLRIALQATSFEAILSLVEAGHGVSVLPRAAVASAVTSRQLVMVPIMERWAVRQLHLAWRSGSLPNADVEHLLKFLHERAVI